MARPRRVETILVDSVVCSAGRRPVDDEAVATLMASFQRLGMRTPISVRCVDNAVDEDGQIYAQANVLISGRHRLEAARRLGWETIEAFVGDCDEVEAELWEIAENLHRAELTAMERDVQVARWIELTEAKIKPAQSAPVSGGRGNTGGINAASRELGIERTDAQRAVKVASLSEEAKATAVELKLDNNRTTLLAAAKAKEAGESDVVFLRQEHARREAEKARKEAERANRNINRVAALSESEQFADWLLARADLREVPMLISWLEGTEAKDVIAALRRRAA